MRQLFILFTLLFFLFAHAKGQIKLAVIDSFSRQALSFASIYQFSSGILLLSKDNGEAELKFNGPDSIRISYAGYNDKIERIEQSGFFEVKLARNIEVLPEVVIKPCVEWSKPIASKLEKDSAGNAFFNWSKIDDISRVAMFIHAQGEKSKLLSFSLDLDVGPGGTKEAAKAPILFSFYSVDTATMLPLDLLTSKRVVYYPKKLGQQWIDVDSLGLMIPEQGMYISLEISQDEAFGYLLPMKMPGNVVDTFKFKLYGASLDWIYTKKSWLSFYDFKRAQWQFSRGKPFDKMKVHGTIKYEIKYAICKEGKK